MIEYGIRLKGGVVTINIDTDKILIIIRLNNKLHQTGLVLSIRRQKLSFDIK